MYHPLPLHAEAVRELPAVLDDSRSRSDEPAAWSYRSEAFAEDLSSSHAELFERAPAVSAGGGNMKLLVALPLGVLLAGALMVFGLA